LSPTTPQSLRAGQVGFGRDMGATRALLGRDEPGQAISATQAALAEAEMGLIDPLRRYKLWRPVRHPKTMLQCRSN
jgi:hypothetical protein